MTVNNLDGTLYIAHLMAAAGGNSSSPGALVNYSTWRSRTYIPVRIRVSSWPTTGAGAKASAMRFSLRNSSDVTMSDSIQINRGDTGWHTFAIIGSVQTGLFRISGRALGFCNYSTPGGAVYDPTGDAFPWSGQIEF
jgi:hypothetical protein